MEQKERGDTQIQSHSQREKRGTPEGYSGSVPACGHRGMSSAASAYSAYSVPHAGAPPHAVPMAHAAPGMPVHVVPLHQVHGQVPQPHPHGAGHPTAHPAAPMHPNYHLSYMHVESFYGDYCELCAKAMKRKVRKLAKWGVTNLASHPSYTPMQTVELYYRHYKKKLAGKPVSATKNARSSRNSDSDYFGHNTCASSSTTTLADRERLDRPEAPLPPGAYASEGEAKVPSSSRKGRPARAPSPKPLQSTHSRSPHPVA
eukprot:TRINITY_DN19622_c0_g1_i1.p2 TRINITY_DN19622_c0_g1~~TRINITY_DN19622_c0_g1_i1.p2  ORF type:complete len:258 (+),score=39.27 TRINITY_DN19622_c0_g1_i1:187-960(+)